MCSQTEQDQQVLEAHVWLDLWLVLHRIYLYIILGNEGCAYRSQGNKLIGG